MSDTCQKVPDAIGSRVARFSDLKSLPIQQDKSIPQEAFDLIYARQLLPVIGLPTGGATALSVAAPISGAAGMTMTMAVCPPGQGPGLHDHRETYETFTVLKGRFEFRLGDDGNETIELQAFDVVSIPPGIYRAFRNVSDEDAVLQVVISGGVHDMNDIMIHKAVGAELKEVSAEFLEKLIESGIEFVE